MFPGNVEQEILESIVRQSGHYISYKLKALRRIFLCPYSMQTTLKA